MKIGISSSSNSESGRIGISTNRIIAEEAAAAAAAAKERKVAGAVVEAATDRNLSATDATRSLPLLD